MQAAVQISKDRWGRRWDLESLQDSATEAKKDLVTHSVQKAGEALVTSSLVLRAS
jgi:arginine/lysine/ornithine decarboxylase